MLQQEKKFYSDTEIFNNIKDDGLIQLISKEQINHTNIENAELAHLWLNLEIAINKIQIYYLVHGGRKL